MQLSNVTAGSVAGWLSIPPFLLPLLTRLHLNSTRPTELESQCGPLLVVEENYEDEWLSRAFWRFCNFYRGTREQALLVGGNELKRHSYLN